MEKQQLLTDQDQNNDIFDKLGVKLDQILLLGENTTYVILIQTEILRIERIFQDLNGFEVLSAINEFVINKSKNILSNWYHVLMMNSSSVIILKMFSTDLKSIIGLLTFINQNDDLNEVKRIIDSKFIMNDIAKLEIEKQFLLFSNSMYDYKKNSSEEQQFLDKSMIAIEQIIKRHSIFHAFDEVNNINIFNEPSGEIFSLDNIDMVYPKRPFLVIEDGENVLYSLKLKLWIDTDNAVEANSFMNIITSTLGLIENVSIKIEGSGVGSYYQKIKMIFKGWFSSQEFEQIVDKTGKAVEAYTLDRHTEPIEHSKIDRQKIKAEIDNMMSKEQSQQLIEIQIDSAKEDLEYKRLLNLEKKIEINSKLSNLLTEKLVNIDSDYRIEIGEAFLLEQKDGKVKYNKDLILDLPFEKEIFDEENQDESENDQGPNLVSTPKKPKRS